jgi:hypothetical protein
MRDLGQFGVARAILHVVQPPGGANHARPDHRSAAAIGCGTSNVFNTDQSQRVIFSHY